MDIPAPGDIRNVIAALSDSESTLTQLFNTVLMKIKSTATH